MKKIILIIIGILSLILGFIGTVLPILPTVPFLLLSACCFGKSSEKLNTWFKSTKIYKNNLESYVKGNGMSKATKIKTLSLVTLLMGTGFYFMGNVPIGRVILAIVWIFHVVYFLFFVKTQESILEVSYDK